MLQIRTSILSMLCYQDKLVFGFLLCSALQTDLKNKYHRFSLAVYKQYSKSPISPALRKALKDREMLKSFLQMRADRASVSLCRLTRMHVICCCLSELGIL